MKQQTFLETYGSGQWLYIYFQMVAGRGKISSYDKYHVWMVFD